MGDMIYVLLGGILIAVIAASRGWWMDFFKKDNDGKTGGLSGSGGKTETVDDRTPTDM